MERRTSAPPQFVNDDPNCVPAISRRGVLGKALAAAAVGVAGVTFLEPGSPATATDGDSVTAGSNTTAEHSTSITYNGLGNFGGVVLLANDSLHLPTETAYPAALGGWAGRGENTGYGTLPNGIYGYTEAGNGHAIVGRNDPQDTGFGGSAVYGETYNTHDDSYAVWGCVPLTSPGAGSAGVCGENRGLGPGGVGVYGVQNGSGYGVFGNSGNGGVGVYGQGLIGVRANGQGTHGIGLDAQVSSKGPAIRASNQGDGAAVHAAAAQGRGGVFSGPTAQLRLIAGQRATHPVDGARGDMYVDNTGRLWFCKKGGTRATWSQLA